MKIIRNFSKKYAILFALLVTVAFRCCMKLKGLLILPLLPDSLAGEFIDTLVGIIWPVGLTILLGLLSMIGIGIREEFIFRGLVMNSLSLKYAGNMKGVWFSLALSGALFGSIYLRVGFFTSSFLVTETTGIQEINNINFESLIAIPITLLIAIFLLRKSKRQELFDRIKEQRNRLGW